ncbi:MAG TPA: hypothetical protein VHM29_01535 [Acidimicrobiia bacterium]|nr:hypothetical protein [Acidimicrobiia bacterium]
MIKKDRRLLDDFVHQLAMRCEAASGFLGQFSTDKSAHALIDTVLGNDPERFNQFLDGFEVPEIPPFEKCLWGRDLIEIVGRHYNSVTECFLRDDLSPEERVLYFTIALRHHQAVPFEEAGGILKQIGTDPIPEGPFLEELKANNLVKCVERLTDAPPVLGLPYEVCLPGF